MAPSAGLLSIGRLARLSRLSVKALRRYADDGLLAPAWIDPDSGYRYYAPDQVGAAATIAVLRSLGVPLPAVRAILEAPDEEALTRLLDAERARAEKELRAREQALASIARLAAGPAAIRYDITVTERPARRLAVVSGVVAAEELGPGTARLCEIAQERLTGAQVPITEGLTALFPLDLADDLTVGVGTEIAVTGTVPDDCEDVTLRGGAWASTLHVGPYDALPLGYQALLDRLTELGHDPAGPVAETYLNDPWTTPLDELVTRIAVPLVPA